MEYNVKEINSNVLNFSDIENPYFLIGLLSEFNNRLQTQGDAFFDNISWKQCFLMICIKIFEKPPTLKELSELMGSSHQNVKQLLIKLEKKDFVKTIPDDTDKRKLRIVMTEKANVFDQNHEEPSRLFIQQIYRNINPEELEITIKTIVQLDDNLKKLSAR